MGGKLAIQKVKNSFVCNMWGWAKLYNGAFPYRFPGMDSLQLRAGGFFVFLAFLL